MLLYLRPTSFELEIAKIKTNQNPIKHLDVLGEIFHILESKPDMQHINIQGFERNTTTRYTITLDTRDQRDTLMDYFIKKPNWPRIHIRGKPCKHTRWAPNYKWHSGQIPKHTDTGTSSKNRGHYKHKTWYL